MSFRQSLYLSEFKVKARTGIGRKGTGISSK